MNVNIVFQIPGLADLVRHLNQPVQRSRDSGSGPVGDDNTQSQRKQRAEYRTQNRACRCQFVGVAPLLQQFVVLLVHIVQHVARTRDPGVRIFLQIENLQFRHRRIAAVHGSALVHQWIGEFIAPGLLQPLHSFQAASLLRRVRQILGVVKGVIQGMLAIIHFLHVARVPAEQIVLQVKPVLHHLEADQRGGLSHVDRTLRRRLGFMLAMHGDQVGRQ